MTVCRFRRQGFFAKSESDQSCHSNCSFAQRKLPNLGEIYILIFFGAANESTRTLLVEEQAEIDRLWGRCLTVQRKPFVLGLLNRKRV